MQQRLTTLRQKLAQAIKQRNYIRASQLQNEINKMTVTLERTTLSTITDTLSAEQRENLITIMNKVMILADLLHGYAAEFEAAVKKADKTLYSIEVCRRASQASSLCLSITKNISAMNDDKYTGYFQSICDEVDLVFSNIIYTRMQRSKRNAATALQ